jgi:hypothetical protein
MQSRDKKVRKMKKYKFLSVFLFAIIIFSCASQSNNYGMLRMIHENQNRATIQDLISNWENFNIYYSDIYEGYNPRAALGIMFYPKNNETTLVGDRWKKVNDQKDLIEMTRWIYSNTQNEPWLNEILGPDGKFYGYLYYSYGFVTLKVVDDKTMFVFNLEEPRERKLFFLD